MEASLDAGLIGLNLNARSHSGSAITKLVQLVTIVASLGSFLVSTLLVHEESDVQDSHGRWHRDLRSCLGILNDSVQAEVGTAGHHRYQFGILSRHNSSCSGEIKC